MKSVASYVLLLFVAGVSLGSTMLLFFRVFHWQFLPSGIVAGVASLVVVTVLYNALGKRV